VSLCCSASCTHTRRYAAKSVGRLPEAGSPEASGLVAQRIKSAAGPAGGDEHFLAVGDLDNGHQHLTPAIRLNLQASILRSNPRRLQ
jgi:hypothetical protein